MKLLNTRSKVEHDNPEKILGVLDIQFRHALLSMYRGEPQNGTEGRNYPLDANTRICPSKGLWIYDLCLSVKPKSTIEIGMAYGFSTIFFLAAIAKNHFGFHTAVDPFQRSYWHGIGFAHAQALVPHDENSGFRLIEDRSDHAAADLSRANSCYQIVFIDGNHRFDDVIVDFYMYAPLCAIGGYMIFDDVKMSSINSVVSFVRANRSDFVEIPTEVRGISVFRKVSNDTREWRHFRKFKVSSDSN